MFFKSRVQTALLSCALVAALAPAATSQTAVQPAAEQARTLYVTVTTEAGQFIRGLGAEAFGVYDGEGKARLVSFSREDAPATVGIVLDASGSMGFHRAAKPFTKMRGALLSLVASAKKTDEFFLVAFNQQPQLLLRDTNDSAAVLATLDRFAATKAAGRTALYDALYLAVNHASNGKHRKRALVVITDGGDTLSQFSFDELKRAVRESDVILYFVVFNPNGFELGYADEQAAQALVTLSGGKAYRAVTEDQLVDSLKRVAEELRSQYALGVVPAAGKENWHEIKIKMAKGRDPQGKLHKLRARTRKGFYWPEKE